MGELIHPVKKVFITQGFGANPDVYKRFGYKGHNGVDYRAFLPNGERTTEGGKSEVFAPHSGRVIENGWDPDGYGWYVKIENEKEGSILAHFSQKGPEVGTELKQGDFVSYQGTTGFSSGIHLHWGYYHIPRDRQNGYGGMIDQIPFINTEVNMDEINKLKADLAESEKHKTNLQNQVNGLLADIEKLKKECETKASAEYGRGYENGLSDGKAGNPSTPVMEGWEENGLTIETTNGNTRTIVNYKKKSS